MLPVSLHPNEVEDKIAKDVEQLSDVGEASYMVPLDPQGVIFSLEDSFGLVQEYGFGSALLHTLGWLVQGAGRVFTCRKGCIKYDLTAAYRF